MSEPRSIAPLIEILGALLTLIGGGTLVAAASMVAVALGVLVAGLELVLLGIVVVYVASMLGGRPPTSQPETAEPQRPAIPPVMG